jgi:hypothetical protein
MNKIISWTPCHHALSIVILLTLSACSSIVKSQHWAPETKDSKWLSSEICMSYGYSDIEFAKFKHKDVSISICPHLKGGRVVAFGPPGVPLLPNPFGLAKDKAEQLTLYIGIDSKTSRTLIDFSKIRIKCFSDTTLSLHTVTAWVAGHGVSTAIDKVYIDHESGRYYLLFDMPNDKVAEITIDLGVIEIDGVSVILPSLIYKTNQRLDYSPLEFTS